MRRGAAELDRLEVQLSHSKASAAKETTRQAYMEVADLNYRRGDGSAAMRYYGRARDYCTTHQNAAEIYLRAIQVSADMKSFVQVTNYTAKAEPMMDTLDVDVKSRFTAASGLAKLESRQFSLAASLFTSVSPEMGDSFNTVIAAEDVATYGTLCTLATCDRAECRRVLEKSAFKNFLGLKPQLQEITSQVLGTHYGEAMRGLEAMLPELELDLYLADRASNLVRMIRERCIVQFFSPYLSVSLTSMAEAFSTSLPEMEAMVAGLIMKGDLAARIDSEKKTLHVREAEQRAESYRKVLELSSSYLSEMKALLLRMSCKQQDFSVKNKHSMLSALGPAGAAEFPGPLFAGNLQDSDAPVPPSSSADGSME